MSASCASPVRPCASQGRGAYTYLSASSASLKGDADALNGRANALHLGEFFREALNSQCSECSECS